MSDATRRGFINLVGRAGAHELYQRLAGRGHALRRAGVRARGATWASPDWR